MGTPMTAKASVFIATSLDGFIARPNGDLDWLDQANTTVTEGEDCGYTAFMDTVDILIMGRNTYEKPHLRPLTLRKTRHRTQPQPHRYPHRTDHRHTLFQNTASPAYQTLR